METEIELGSLIEPPQYTRYGERKRHGMIYDVEDFFAHVMKERPDLTFEVENDIERGPGAIKVSAVAGDGKRFSQTAYLQPDAMYEGGALCDAYDKLKCFLPTPPTV